MSIEEHVQALTKALDRHSTALEAFVKVAGKAPGGTTSSSSSSSSSTKDGDKKKSEEKPTVDTIKSRFGDYMSVTDTDERKKRRDLVAKIAKHFGAERVSEVDAEHYVEVLGYLDQIEAGKSLKLKPRPEADEAGDGDGDSPI